MPVYFCHSSGITFFINFLLFFFHSLYFYRPTYWFFFILLLLLSFQSLLLLFFQLLLLIFQLICFKIYLFLFFFIHLSIVIHPLLIFSPVTFYFFSESFSSLSFLLLTNLTYTLILLQKLLLACSSPHWHFYSIVISATLLLDTSIVLWAFLLQLHAIWSPFCTVLLLQGGLLLYLSSLRHHYFCLVNLIRLLRYCTLLSSSRKRFYFNGMQFFFLA